MPFGVFFWKRGKENVSRSCPARMGERGAALSRFPASEATGGARREGSMGQLVKLLRCFRSDDTGAVTIDWVFLTSGMLLLGIMVIYTIFNVGVSSLTANVNSTLAAVITADAGPAPALNSGVGVSDPEDSDRRCYRFFRWIICFG